VDGSVSWPVGLGGTFHPELTGAQNTRFVARCMAWTLPH
jgi:capsular polysaccharide transport system ATP-binding protein